MSGQILIPTTTDDPGLSRRQAALIRRIPHIFLALLFCAVCMYIWRSSTALIVVPVAAAYGTMSLGQGLCIGYAGILSFGHVAFAGVGGYAFVVASTDREFSAPLAAVIALLIGGVLGTAVGWPLLKLAGYYFALASLGLWLASYNLFSAWRSVTGGYQGRAVRQFGLDPVVVSIVFVGVYVAIAILVELFRRSATGREVQAIRDEPEVAAGAGIHVHRVQVLFFGTTTAISALGGALYAAEIGYISPDLYSLRLIILLLASSVIGGVTSSWGPFFGALIIVTIQDRFAGYDSFTSILFGAVLLLIVLVAPDGLVGLARQLWGLLEPKLLKGGSVAQSLSSRSVDPGVGRDV